LTEPQYLTVGRILRPHGVRGEVVLEVLTDFPEALPGKSVYLQAETEEAAREERQVEAVRWHRGRLLLRLAGATDRNSVEDLRGLLVQIDRGAAEPLAAGQYYHHQIVGLRVVGENGQALGRVTEILETGANDVYVVETPEGGELLLPAIRDVILRIDVEAGEITAHVMEEL
jgi:16S rRNA processing protein RimM